MLKPPALPLISTLAVLLAVLPGCRSADHGAGNLEVRSLNTAATLTPAIRTACYKRVDASTADLYFSDLPEGRLVDPADDLSDATGSIVHIHYFLEPSPGNTPIDDTACNATVRHVLIAAAPATPSAAPAPAATPRLPETVQVFGIYGGGGFFYPSGPVGEETFGGTMRDGTHRLLYASPGFKDVLGPSTIGGEMAATRDDAVADAIESRIQHFLQRVPAEHVPRH
jgi:hypothetical protein